MGTIFSFDPTTNTLITLKGDFDFTNHTPQGNLVVLNGYLYGSLAYHQGSVFRMAIDGSGFTIIHSFDPVEFGSLPQPLTLGPDGKLYGVALYNGIFCNANSNLRCGKVFRLKPVLPGDTDEQFETLYQMQDRFEASPQRRVVYGSDGLLYFNNHLRIFRLIPQDPNPASTFQRIWEETGGSISMSIIEGSDYNAVRDDEPVFSPDGGKIAFSSNRDGSYEIYVMNADGTNQARLTNLLAGDSTPSFSPDGNRIAFTSARNGFALGISSVGSALPPDVRRRLRPADSC